MPPSRHNAGMTDSSNLTPIRRQLAADRETLRAAVGTVPADKRRQKPASDRWSVAEVLEHLAIVEERTVTLMQPFVANAPALDGAATPTPLDRTALRDRAQKVSAPEMIHPTGAEDAEAIWQRLQRSRDSLLALIDLCEGRDLATIERTHPALGRIDGYQWLTSIGAHEERHAAQIVEIGQQLAGA